MAEDRVRLTIDSVEDAAAPARVTGAGLAFRLGLPYQSVEDFRVAVDAAVTLASSYLESPLQVIFTLDSDRLCLELCSETSDTGDRASAPDAGALRAFEAVVGELVAVQHVDDQGSIHLVVEKLAEPEAPK